MTDITGFGLIGHLREMISASHVSAQLSLAEFPLHKSVLRFAHAGIASTLLPENLWLADVLDGAVDDTARAILFDPQTSDGLLAGIPAEHARKCVAELTASGYAGASIIGHVAD